MRLLPAIAANIFLAASTFGFGNLAQGLFPETFSLLDRFSLTILAGLGTLGTILFCVGQVWFSRTAIFLVLLFGVLLAIRPAARELRDFRAPLARISAPVLPLVIVVAVLLVTAIGGLTIPSGDMNNDAIAYHYYGPKVWLRDAVIRPVPDEALTSFPAVVETQYAALMSLGGQRAPQFFAVISFIAILCTAASVAIRMGLDPSCAWWVVALVATMPAVYRGVFGGFIDALVASFILAAARIAFDADQPGHFILFGIFGGISMGAKYTGMIAWVLLISCTFLILRRQRRLEFKDILKYLCLSSGIAIAIACPVYIRNWIFLGAPIYPPPPAAYKFLHVKYLSVDAAKGYYAYIAQRGAGLGHGLGAYFLLPFNLTYHTADFNGAGGIGLAPLALAPFGLVVSLRQWFARALALLAFLLATVWFLTQQESRFLIPVYVIAAIFSVLGWEYTAQQRSRYVRAISVVAIAISVLYGLSMIVPGRVDDMHAALSNSFESDRRYREDPMAVAFDYINDEPTVGNILILNNDVAAYHLNKPYLKPFGRWGVQTLPDATDVAEVMAQLPSLHVTDILDVKSEGGRFQLPENPSNLTLVFQTPNERIYRVDRKSSHD